MIKFILGRSGYGKSDRVLGGIKADLASGKRVYLIVPDQQAVVWEQKATTELSPSAFLSLDIVGFSRLGDLVCRRFGNMNYNYINKGEKSLVLWSAILSVSGALSVYGSAAGGEDRLVPMFLDAIGDMKRHRITPAMLEGAALKLRQDGDGAAVRLGDRLLDLALIYSAYDTLVTEKFGDADDELTKLEDTLSRRDFFGGTSVYIDSYHSLYPVQYGIVECIMRQADDVTFTVTTDKDSPEPQFEYTGKLYAGLRSAAEKLSLPYTAEVLTEDIRHESDALKHLESNLWNYSAEPFSEDAGDAVVTFRCVDRYDEGAAVAAEIKRLIHGGARYRDIAVIAGNVDKLRGILDTALDRENIPYHISRRAELAAEPATRLLFAALSVCSGGWRTEDMIAAAKTELFSLTEDESDFFERYVNTWRLRGRAVYENEWVMNPDGYSADMTEQGAFVLADVNSAREKLAEPLAHFADTAAGGVVAVTTLAKACYDLLVELDVYGKLEARAAVLDSAGKHDEAIKCRQVFSALCGALDTVALTLPDAKADTARFARLLRRIVDETDIGSIPSASDEVILGAASSVRTDNVKYVLIPGVIDGEFPKIPDESGFFSDSDKIMLEGCDITLSEKTGELAAKELFSFYRAVTAASCGVRIFIPATDGGASVRPSDGADRIKALFPDAPVVNYGAEPASSRIWSEASLISEATKQGGELASAAAEFVSLPADAKGIDNAEDCRISPAVTAAIFPTHMALSQSRLDTYVLCRFGYYCKYVMRLAEDKKAAIKQVDVGNFVHRILELYYAETHGLETPLTPEQSEALSNKLADDYLAVITRGKPNARLEYMFGRLKKQVRVFIRDLDREFAQSGFTPYKFELPVAMGDDDSPPPLVFRLEDGSTVSLRGVIDRLDVYREDGKTYIRVVDYKTGTKKFSLTDIEMGLNMQLLLYLFTVAKCPPSKFRRELAGDGEIVPAGALYHLLSLTEANVPSFMNDLMHDDPEMITKSEEGVIFRDGIITDDMNIIRQMDKTTSGVAKYALVTYNKDGGLSKASKIASAEEFERLYGVISKNITDIAEAMRGGEMQARPMKARSKNPCEYCKMKAVCRTAGKSREGGLGNGGEEMDGGAKGRD